MSELFWPDENLVRFDRTDFDKFIEWSFDKGASDIFLEPGELLCTKIHGECVDVGRKPLRYEEISEILKYIYDSSATAILKSGGEINFPYTVLREDESLIRFRVSVTACQGMLGADAGIEMVLRTIPGEIPDYADLGLPEELIDACGSKFGIVLVTGPTGSGKSTSIAAMLKHIVVNYPVHVITYEAPIEFIFKTIPNRKARIVQSEIPNNIKTFRLATANSLRRAPDVVFFGEARDQDTIEAAIREASTGHLVFTTVHTNSVASTISRMVDEFSPGERLGTTRKLVDALRVILHQRLYRKLGGGRVAVREYLILNDEMRRHLQVHLLTNDEVGNALQALVEKYGVPLLSDAKKLFKDGSLDFAEYASIVAEVGKGEDLSIVPGVAQDLLDKGIITKKLYGSWINAFEGAVDA